VPDRSLKKKLRKKAKKAQRRRLGEAIEKDGHHARERARDKKK
jgi:hypothetical protein